MAYYWVQQWFALPLIPENPMGNEETDGNNLLSEDLNSPQRRNQDRRLENSTQNHGPINPIVESVPSNSALSLPYRNTSVPLAQARQFQYPYGVLPSQDAPSTYSVAGNIPNTLPDYARDIVSAQAQSQQTQQQGRSELTAALTPTTVYQLQRKAQFVGQAVAPLNGSQSSDHNLPYTQLRQGFRSAQNQHFGHYESLPNNHIMTPNINHNFYPTYAHSQQYTYWPNFYSNPAILAPGTYQNPGPFERRSSAPLVQRHYYAGGMNSIDHSPNANRSTMVRAVAGDYGVVSASATKSGIHGITRRMSDSGLNTMPRGPPRKPKQSGHALWIGNLPPGTNIIDLKNHFSRDAANDIESLFLISKSNCAFVNYKTEAACAAAMNRFHDSRFFGVRLVCRLRRNAAPASGVPAGPSAMVSSQHLAQSLQVKDEANETDKGGSGPQWPERLNEEGISDPPSSGNRVAEKYFIVKSLTLQDLEISVQNGIWATQSHNEEKLNNAYHIADNVYLIFSVNKSGEYFGYARMVSPILSDAEEIQRKNPHSSSQSSAVEAPRAIPTPMTETAPKGHIIDDSARGTIFWEADRSDSDENDESTLKGRDELDQEPDPDVPATWGKPFRIEWLSTTRLPFFRTRGLRNPWNANREVKIARDGTELETNAGRKLVQMFIGAAQVPPNQAIPQLGIGQTNTVRFHGVPPGAGQIGVQF